MDDTFSRMVGDSGVMGKVPEHEHELSLEDLGAFFSARLYLEDERSVLETLMEGQERRGDFSVPPQAAWHIQRLTATVKLHKSHGTWEEQPLLRHIAEGTKEEIPHLLEELPQLGPLFERTYFGEDEAC